MVDSVDYGNDYGMVAEDDSYYIQVVVVDDDQMVIDKHEGLLHIVVGWLHCSLSKDYSVLDSEVDLELP